jgi:hypothetical protein
VIAMIAMRTINRENEFCSLKAIRLAIKSDNFIQEIKVTLFL